MGPNKEAFIASIISGYEIDVSKLIAHEIRYKATITNLVMAFPCLLTQIFLEAGVPELLDINRFFRLRITNNLGLVRDITNPISKMEKLGVSKISKAYKARGDDTTGFTNISDTLTETD